MVGNLAAEFIEKSITFCAMIAKGCLRDYNKLHN